MKKRGAVAGTLVVGAIAAVFMRTPPPAHGEFRGTLNLEHVHAGCMRLVEDFAYIDAKGREWKAPAGYTTDGASIPRAVWSLVGSPFTGDYLKAAVIHDVYCDKRHTCGFSSDEVHRVFHEACICGGVSAPHAKLLFLAVSGFGPQWALTDSGPVGEPGCATAPSADGAEETPPVAEPRTASPRVGVRVLPEYRVQRERRLPPPSSRAPASVPAPATSPPSSEERIRRVLQQQLQWIEAEAPALDAVRARARTLRTVR